MGSGVISEVSPDEKPPSASAILSGLLKTDPIAPECDSKIAREWFSPQDHSHLSEYDNQTSALICLQ